LTGWYFSHLPGKKRPPIEKKDRKKDPVIGNAGKEISLEAPGLRNVKAGIKIFLTVNGDLPPGYFSYA
jgi:hypothetical protein